MRVRACLLVLCSSWLPLARPATVLAEWRPSGAVTAHALVGEKEGGRRAYGGGGLVDIWEPIGPLRIGGVLGIAALSDAQAERSRVFMPGGLSMAVIARVKRFGLEVRLRGGPWAGAIDEGLVAGGWVAVGTHIEYAPDPHVALAAGTDLWFLFGHGNALVVAPGIGLVWTIDAEE